MILIALSLSIAVCSPLFAKNWPEVAGWEIAEVGENACAAMIQYEGKGNSRLTLLKSLDDEKIILFDNELWSIEKNKKYAISFNIDNKIHIPDNFANGNSDLLYRYISIKIDNKIYNSLSNGNSLKIIYWPGITDNDKYPENDLDDPVVVDSLSLNGSGAAMLYIEKCLAHVRNVANSARREKQKYDHLPDDPFAN